jgi:hypothetical protein
VKLAVTSLHAPALCLIACFVGGLRVVPRQGQDSAIEGQFNSGGLDARQVYMQFESVRIFVDIHVSSLPDWPNKSGICG